MFRDRADAGRQLGARLVQESLHEPLVLGLGRGGVPVAVKVAEALQAEVDTLTVRRVTHPDRPDVGLGVVTESEVALLDDQLVGLLQLDEAAASALVDAARSQVERQAQAVRAGRARADVAGRDVVLVDDGVSSGLTARLGIKALRRWNVGRIVLALPVASPAALAGLEGLVDRLVCLTHAEAVGVLADCYEDFAEVDDALAGRLLREARARILTVRQVALPAAGATVAGTLVGPAQPTGVVVVVPGIASAARSPRNVLLARQLASGGLGVLLVDLLDANEAAEGTTAALLASHAERVVGACRWVASTSAWAVAHEGDAQAQLPVGLLASGSGAAAALLAVGRHGADVAAIVARDGRPDLADDVLGQVSVPTLLVVGGRDERGERLALAATYRLHGPAEVAVVAGASALFEEPGALAEVGRKAAAWFARHLSNPADAAAGGTFDRAGGGRTALLGR
jgi:putative phosphoribosyl transferase